MTMDPRIEAALVAFARTQLVPPGYTLHEYRNGDVYIIEPWVVLSEQWRHSAATKELACAAAWKRSDRRGSLPTTYCIMGADMAHDLTGERYESTGERYCAVLPEGISSKLAWRSDPVATIEDARELAWDHYDAHPNDLPAPPSEVPLSMQFVEEGGTLTVISTRGDRYLGGDGSGVQQPPADCRWDDNGELVCCRAPHSLRCPLTLGHTTNGGIYLRSVAVTIRVDDDVIRYFLDHFVAGK